MPIEPSFEPRRRKCISDCNNPIDDLPNFDIRSDHIDHDDPEIPNMSPYIIVSQHGDPREGFQQRVLSQCSSGQTVFWPQLSSPVDPFFASSSLTPREQSMLQFILVRGRTLFPGGSENDRYCIVLKVMQKSIPQGRNHAIAFIVVAQAALCTLTGAEGTPDFFERRASMYAHARKALSTPATSFSEKFLSLLYLVYVEYALGLDDLQAKHALALSQLVELRGGTLKLALQEPGCLRITPRLYVPVFCITRLPLTDMNTCDRFLIDLYRIAKWAKRMESLPDADRLRYQSALTSLCEAMHEPGLSEPYALAVTPFLVCFSICITFAEHEWDAEWALDFLLRCQHYILMTGYSCAVSVVAMCHLFEEVRIDMGVVHDGDEGYRHESMIAQSSIGAIQVTSLLSQEMLESLRWKLCAIALILTKQVSEDILNRSWVDEILEYLMEKKKQHLQNQALLK